MKKFLAFVFLLMVLPIFLLSAESFDKVWIVKKNSGSVSTMEKLQNPEVSPGDVLHILLSVKELQAKWGEGYVQWKYEYRGSSGKTIWESKYITHKEQADGNTWDFLRVIDVTIPKSIPEGEYNLGFTLLDYHTKIEYRGWIDFTVGGKEAATASAEEEEQPTQQPKKQEYTVWIEKVELTLKSVKKTSNRLIFTFTGINHGEEEQDLRVYPYSTRIISGRGREYNFSDVGGGGKLSKGTTFSPDIPMETDIYFRNPATNADGISLLHIDFYYTQDVLKLKSIPVPWP